MVVMLKQAVLMSLAVFCSLTVTAAEEQNYPFVLETRKEGDSHHIVARNRGAAAVSVKVSLANSRNAAPDRPFPLFAVIPPGGGSVSLARIRPAARGAGYSFRTQASWLLGDYHARQSSGAIYRLPYANGRAFHIGQSPGGPLSTHRTPDSEYAVDIGMPEGTPVVAARDGIVVYTEARERYGGRHPDLIGRANSVRIQHSDGTIALYAHLAHAGVNVFPGQRVKAGMQIGLSGSTGYSSGPHLHFAIQTVLHGGDRLTTTSLPFNFYVGQPPAVFPPRFGMFATAQYSSPGKVPITTVPGPYKPPLRRPQATGREEQK
ncbi:MAG: Glycyl-glycine endopeptidase ALE-1 precursor [Candidatus Accumulibacter appositus]|uniref:Glycyl-glycine endopeptidase ALE-1 n=1 Tax=Candidatus Accumulibacter appositus TaxID=1454003 RepID=A0A011PXS4_9PROT|nr:M23 family metallopeptidase [Accumulibacter sp.]EXI81665.1 MAG: Glycyl-glycine endopeptidase ALE-1 precursor [Candidatus Accumulibacter appositus]HRF06683.1 M23 family metallopeptidase [Accumulibacter sp.]